MTVQSRGAGIRRGGRGPGWVLLTALLVLAILASSTLVFTNRVELLRLAVILSLWAAVMAAFVTVIYRRQTDVAQARAKDMKFVYDLQLDREISARREYELSVEARLRRQLSREGVQAADEMAALRAELVSLRSQLEVMLGTDLAPRPALESERVAVAMPAPPGRVESSRVTVVTEDIITVVEESDYEDESPIIDVAEEPLPPVYEEPVAAPPVVEQDPYFRSPPRGSRPVAEQYLQPPAPPQPEGPWRPPEARPGRHVTGPQNPPPPPYPPRPQYPPGPQFAPAPEPEVLPRGRHWVPPESPPNPAGRHRGAPEPVVEERPAEDIVEEPDEHQGQHADGQSFADLMQRLQIDRPSGGGGRRRRGD